LQGVIRPAAARGAPIFEKIAQAGSQNKGQHSAVFSAGQEDHGGAPCQRQGRHGAAPGWPHEKEHVKNKAGEQAPV